MASSSSAISNPNYDVFLSFRGADTRNNFTSHLYNALRRENVNAFMDKELKRGEQISSTLFLLIKNSKISIIVFSPNYAASKFCLDELVKILECKVSRQQVVLPVLYKVDPFEVEKLTGKYGRDISSYESEFKGFKRFFYSKRKIKEKKEKVKRWKSALAEAADLDGWDSRDRDEVEITRGIVEQVLQKLHGEHSDRGLFKGVLALNEPQTRRELLVAIKTMGKKKKKEALIWAKLNLIDNHSPASSSLNPIALSSPNVTSSQNRTSSQIAISSPSLAAIALSSPPANTPQNQTSSAISSPSLAVFQRSSGTEFHAVPTTISQNPGLLTSQDNGLTSQDNSKEVSTLVQVTEERISRLVATAIDSKINDIKDLFAKSLAEILDSDDETGSDADGLDGRCATNVVDNGISEPVCNIKGDGLDGHLAASTVETAVAGTGFLRKVSFAEKLKESETDDGGMDKSRAGSDAERLVVEAFPPLPQRNTAGPKKMKGLPPLVSVLDPEQQKRNQSFLDIVTTESANKNFHQTMYQGAPAVIVSKEDEKAMTIPYRYALVGKFVKQRPLMERIRQLFVNLNLKAVVQIQHLDFRHVLINLHSEEDYSRVWARKSYDIEGRIMRILKWSPHLRPSEESPVVPVWISFPNLPIHFTNNKDYVRSLASVIGYPLRMDMSTAAGSKPALARALVEVDVTKNQIPRIRCGSEDYSYWQTVIYENVPNYCNACKHLGHNERDCYVKDPTKRPAYILKKSNIPAEKIDHEGLGGLDVPATSAVDTIHNTISTTPNRDILQSEMAPPSNITSVNASLQKVAETSHFATNATVYKDTSSALKWSAVDEEYDGEVEIEFSNGDTLVLPNIGMVKNIDQTKVKSVRQFKGNVLTKAASTLMESDNADTNADIANTDITENEFTQVTRKRDLRSKGKQPQLTPANTSTQNRKGFKMRNDRTLRSRFARSQSVNLFDSLNCYSDGDKDEDDDHDEDD